MFVVYTICIQVISNDINIDIYIDDIIQVLATICTKIIIYTIIK